MSEEEYRQHVNKINENIGNILKDHDEELIFYVNLVKRFNDICEESKKQKEVIDKINSFCKDDKNFEILDLYSQDIVYEIQEKLLNILQEVSK